MKKTLISILLISLASTMLAQPKPYDDKKQAPKQTQVKPVAKPAPVKAIARPQPVAPVARPQPVAPVARPQPVAPVARPAQPVVVRKPVQRVVVRKQPQPIVVRKPVQQVVVHKPAPVKFVVKKPKPNPGLLGLIFGVKRTPPPPSRAVVIVTSTVSKPVYAMADLDREPQLVEAPSIEYPENMLNAGLSGVVVMDVQIDKDGYVGLERVVSSTSEDFEKEAIASLSTFKYEQPLKNGYPVNARFTLTIPFEITEE